MTAVAEHPSVGKAVGRYIPFSVTRVQYPYIHIPIICPGIEYDDALVCRAQQRVADAQQTAAGMPVILRTKLAAWLTA
jgi:hypothetical protein